LFVTDYPRPQVPNTAGCPQLRKMGVPRAPAGLTLPGRGGTSLGTDLPATDDPGPAGTARPEWRVRADARQGTRGRVAAGGVGLVRPGRNGLGRRRAAHRGG